MYFNSIKQIKYNEIYATCSGVLDDGYYTISSLALTVCDLGNLLRVYFDIRITKKTVYDVF